MRKYLVAFIKAQANFPETIIMDLPYRMVPEKLHDLFRRVKIKHPTALAIIAFSEFYSPAKPKKAIYRGPINLLIP